MCYSRSSKEIFTLLTVSEMQKFIQSAIASYIKKSLNVLLRSLKISYDAMCHACHKLNSSFELEFSFESDVKQYLDIVGFRHTCILSANTPALLLRTSIFGCAFLISSASLLTCDIEERSAAKACTLELFDAFWTSSAAAFAFCSLLYDIRTIRPQRLIICMIQDDESTVYQHSW